MTENTDRPPLEILPYPQDAPDACRTTRHCADHGFCRRCQPGLAAVMSRVNSAIQKTDETAEHWGPLYAAVGQALRGALVQSATQPPATYAAPELPANRVAILNTAPVSAAAVAPPTDQTDRAALVEVAAQAIRDSNGTPAALAWWQAHPQLIPAHVYADAVLAVLPSTRQPSRAAILREEADRIRAHCPDHLDSDSQPGSWMVCHCDVADELLRRVAGEAQQPETRAEEQPLVHIGWWCWRGNNHGHLATMACRSDNVPLHVPAEWADEMRAVIQRLEDGDDEDQPAVSQPAEEA
ncbi:hypothetical protein [Streptomyces sp. NPDC005732]|uniref:hypothetical protein n=1 Tax=Streptomyces sp. NPDC005732 TaxID=3157057 RepID=UPI0033DBE32B